MFAFVLAKQTVINKHAGELLANGTVNQSSGDRRVHTARQTENDFFVTHLGTNLLDSLFHIVTHDPGGFSLTDIQNETIEDLTALKRVSHFRVELHGIVMTGFVTHTGDRARRRRTHHLEAFGQDGNLIAVAHPHLHDGVAGFILEVFDTLEQFGIAVIFHFCVTEFALTDVFNLAAQLLSHGLHAVADTEDRYSGVKNGVADAIGAFLIGAHVRARQNDALRIEFTNKAFTDVVRMHFAVNMGFTDATGDKLRHLGTEVQNKNTIVCHCRLT